MTRSPGAWPRKSSSVHRKRRESTTAEGPCTPSGCQRAVGSGRYRSPSSRYLYRVPGATLAMVRVKTSSAPRVIGWGRRPSLATSTDRHRGAQTAKVTVSSRTLAPSTFIRSNEPTYGLGLRAGLPHPPPGGAESRPVASRQRLALRGRVRVLPPPARDRPPPGRRRHLAQVDDQPLPDPHRAARLAGVPEGALFLLRERPARLRGIARALRGRRQQGDRAARVLLGRVLRAHVGDAPPDRRRHPRYLRRAPARRLHRYAHLFRNPRLPPAPRPRRVDPPPAPHRRRNAPPPLRPGAPRHLAPGVRVSAALRVDPADRARQWPRPEGQARHRGIARQARARVLRGGRAPRLGRRSRLSLPRLHAGEGATRRAGQVGAWDRGPLALRVVSGRVARRQRDGGRVLPRPEDHAPGLEPRARLSGGLRVPRVPQEALPRRAALLAHHGQLRRPRPQDRVRPCARRAESRPPGPPFRRARDVHAGRGPRRRAGRRLLALRRGALRPLVVRGPALARAGHPGDGARRRRAAGDARGRAGRRGPAGAARLPRGRRGRGRGPPGRLP